MKRLSIRTFTSTLLLIILLSSCQEKKAVYFRISLLINGSTDSKTQQILKGFCNYLSSEKSDTIFVPEVTIVRTDRKPESSEAMTVPLSSLNRFRKWIGMLSVRNLEVDYRDGINKVTTPTNLELPAGAPMQEDSLRKRYPDLKLLRSADSSTKRLIQEIQDQLRTNPSEKQFTVLLSTFTAPAKPDDDYLHPSQNVTPDNIPKKLPALPAGAVNVGYGIFSGHIVNGKLVSGATDATLIFTQSHIISPNDPEKRIATPGEKVVGCWIDGQLSHGILYHKDGQPREYLYLGSKD